MKLPNEAEDIFQKYRHRPTKIPLHATDHFGFVCADAPPMKPDSRLIDAWLEAMSAGDIRGSSKVKKLIFRGVPIPLKDRVWGLLNQPIGTLQADIYDILKRETCTYEYQIHVDVQRTFRKHGLFFDEYGVGQVRLFGILVAYANLNKKVGYCQGMSSFAGLLLMYFPEKRSFDIMRHLIDKNRLENLFDNQLSMLNSFIFVQNEVCLSLIPHLYNHIIASCELSVFISGWYLTLFSRFEIELVLRVWDLFMYYDVTIFFLVVAALLKANKDVIMKKQSDQLIHYLTGMENTGFDVEKVVGYVKRFLKEGGLEKYREALKISY